MFHFHVRDLFRQTLFRDVGSLIVFAGAFAQRADLRSAGTAALSELSEHGYSFSSSADPVRIYPLPAGAVGTDQAGAWRPGVVALREFPEGDPQAVTALRHELMHEARYRACQQHGAARANVGVPWAEEAAAIAFSGETRTTNGEASEAAIGQLRRLVRTGAVIRSDGYETLRRLVVRYGWPTEPCAVSNDIASLVSDKESWRRQGLSYVIVSALTGRVVERVGDTTSPHALGSVLKLPYVAALRAGEPNELGLELARSDTNALSKRLPALDLDIYRQLLQAGAPVDEAALREALATAPASLLGERLTTGSFLVQQSLEQFAWVVRAAWFRHPESLRELWRNGVVEGSTLARSPRAVRDTLRALHAVAKTGTVATFDNQPVLGHLVLIWPREQPEYIAVLSAGGVAGAGVAERATSLFPRLLEHYPPGSGRVRMRMLTRLPGSSLTLSSNCPLLVETPIMVSTCGALTATTLVKSVRTERVFSGIAERQPDGTRILITDPESYADDVFAAEAAALRGEAARALRAVIVWNGVHSRGRHPAWNGLCDTTHCMVSLGALPDQPHRGAGKRTDGALLRVLDRCASRFAERWFPFSRGGEQPWVEVRSAEQIRSVLGGDPIIDISRERAPDGHVVLHLTYDGFGEDVKCSLFQSKLHLPSCPEQIRGDKNAEWKFSGRGAGHGEGLDLGAAEERANSGYSAAEILEDAYRCRSRVDQTDGPVLGREKSDGR